MNSYYRKNKSKKKLRLGRKTAADSISGVRRHKSSLKKKNKLTFSVILSVFIIILAIAALIAVNVIYFYGDHFSSL